MLKILAAVRLKGHARNQAVVFASLDGEVLLATANALEVFQNHATTTAYAPRLAIAAALRVIYLLTAVLNVKVALETPATGMEFVNLMGRVNVILNIEGALVKLNALVQMTKPMASFAWAEGFAT